MASGGAFGGSEVALEAVTQDQGCVAGFVPSQEALERLPALPRPRPGLGGDDTARRRGPFTRNPTSQPQILDSAALRP